MTSLTTSLMTSLTDTRVFRHARKALSLLLHATTTTTAVGGAGAAETSVSVTSSVGGAGAAATEGVAAAPVAAAPVATTPLLAPSQLPTFEGSWVMLGLVNAPSWRAKDASMSVTSSVRAPSWRVKEAPADGGARIVSGAPGEGAVSIELELEEVRRCETAVVEVDDSKDPKDPKAHVLEAQGPEGTRTRRHPDDPKDPKARFRVLFTELVQGGMAPNEAAVEVMRRLKEAVVSE